MRVRKRFKNQIPHHNENVLDICARILIYINELNYIQ